MPEYIVVRILIIFSTGNPFLPSPPEKLSDSKPNGQSPNAQHFDLLCCTYHTNIYYIKYIHMYIFVYVGSKSLFRQVSLNVRWDIRQTSCLMSHRTFNETCLNMYIYTYIIYIYVRLLIGNSFAFLTFTVISLYINK